MAEKKSEFRHLVRIANTDLKGEKQIGIALTNIKGVGKQYANAVCSVAEIDKTKKSGDLSDDEVKKIEAAVLEPIKSGFPMWMLNRRKDPEEGLDRHILTGDLNFVQDNDLKILKKIKSYRGYRHAFGLPVRGQRTKSNFRRAKGKVQGVKKNPNAKKGK